MYWVYILKSLKVNRYYVGHTYKLVKRLDEHNSGKTTSSKGFIPWEIVYTEEFKTKSEAIKREKEIKCFKSGIKFKQLLKSERWQSG